MARLLSTVHLVLGLSSRISETGESAPLGNSWPSGASGIGETDLEAGYPRQVPAGGAARAAAGFVSLGSQCWAGL